MSQNLTLALPQFPAAVWEAPAEALTMDETEFRAFYGRTARALRGYLIKMSADAALADDLLQEAYYRFLRARLPEMSDDHRRNYLFRIATNLLRDAHRSGRRAPTTAPEFAVANAPADDRTEDLVHMRQDMDRALDELKPKQRQLLWLAYVEGASHKEIAGIVGMKEQSVRPLLFRARSRLAEILRQRGIVR